MSYIKIRICLIFHFFISPSNSETFLYQNQSYNSMLDQWKSQNCCFQQHKGPVSTDLHNTEKVSIEHQFSSVIDKEWMMLPPTVGERELENRTLNLPYMTLFNSGNKNKSEVCINSCDNNDFLDIGNYNSAEWTLWWCFWQNEHFNKTRLVDKG